MRIKIYRPGPHASVKILRARGFRVLKLLKGRFLLYTPIRHWSHAL